MEEMEGLGALARANDARVREYTAGMLGLLGKHPALTGAQAVCGRVSISLVYM